MTLEACWLDGKAASRLFLEMLHAVLGKSKDAWACDLIEFNSSTPKQNETCRSYKKAA